MESNISFEEADGVIVRHGEAMYKQGIVDSLEEAKDLTVDGVAQVIENAQPVVDSWAGLNKRIGIFYSDFGRTAETARIWKKLASAQDIKTRGEFPCSNLREVKNLDFNGFFIKLVEGGNLELGGRSFYVSQDITNPGKFSYGDYYKQGGFLHLPEYLHDLIRSEAGRIETYEQVTGRFDLEMARIRSYNQDMKHVIVTHQALPDGHIKQAGLEGTFELGECLPFKWDESKGLILKK
ncbi:MAG: hypothetical protein ABIE22_03300 [archaeon]